MENVRLRSRLACTCIALCCATKISVGVVWDTVVFRDDFNFGPGPPDPEQWIVNHPGKSWWTQGRTHFPDPLSTTGPFPRVELIQDGDQTIGVCVIEHHHYNPWDLDDPNEWFLGGEIHTVREFDARRSYRIEARVRSHANPNGLVTSFFTYGYDGSNSDEIDFEFLSNKTNDNTTYPNGDPVLTNSWNESHECPEYVMPEGLDLTAWNTFRIYWYPQSDAKCPNGGRVEWWWVDPVNGETWLRTEVEASCVPDEPMALYFNYWAPCYTGWSDDCNPWDEAADRNLQPKNTLDQNQVYRYEIDYVEVRVPEHGLTESAKLLASDAAAYDDFGVSVSVSGDTAVVGAYIGDHQAGSDSGSAYVFIRTGSVWTEQQKLTASDAAGDDFFGVSVSMSGDAAVVGAFADDNVGTDSGSAYVFVRVGGVWTQQQKLTAVDAAGGDYFGNSVSVSGDTGVVGAYADDNVGTDSGSAYVYVRSGGVWTLQQKLTASDAAAFDFFGNSVSVSGDTTVVGAFGDDDAGTDSGSAYVFVRVGGVWTQQQKLTAWDAAGDDWFGSSVSVSGDTTVVGAWDDDGVSTNSGSAYVYVRAGSVWTPQQKLTASDAAAYDFFGNSVSVTGDTAVVGANADDDAGVNSGSAYVFVRSGGVWTQQQKLTASDAAATDSFGTSVSVGGNTVVVGAYFDTHEGGESAGSAYVFTMCADSDGDGVCDADDVCPWTPPCVAVDAQGRPLGDLDADCDTDLLDFQLFQQGFNGDLVSWKFFQQGFTGPIQP